MEKDFYPNIFLVMWAAANAIVSLDFVLGRSLLIHEKIGLALSATLFPIYLLYMEGKNG